MAALTSPSGNLYRGVLLAQPLNNILPQQKLLHFARGGSGQFFYDD
ncbi:hypothetical protein SEEK9263_14406, partial [Salmonella enterica subsp. enterica serovar Kentucky str. ATCC 9263]